MSCHLVLQHKELLAKTPHLKRDSGLRILYAFLRPHTPSLISSFQWKVGAFSPAKYNTRSEKSKADFLCFLPMRPSRCPDTVEKQKAAWLASAAALCPQGPGRHSWPRASGLPGAWDLGPPPSGGGRRACGQPSYHLTGEPSKAQIVKNG